jgi:perosamine synthetase
MKYSLNKPFIDNLEINYAKSAINSGWLSVNGRYNKILEYKFGKFVNNKFSLSVQSGTAALHLALKAIGTKPHHKIIIPSFSCSANISSIAQCNATAIIVDIEEDTYGLDYNLVKEAIKKHRIFALQLVHIYGHPARDTEKIIKLCKIKKIKIIEDGSEALGAKIREKKVGQFGDISVFSLRSEKMIGVGEGAIICTNKKNIYQKLLLLGSRNMPYRSSKHPYWKKYVSLGEGYNYLMPHILAAIGCAQLKKINFIIKNKIRVGKIYQSVFKNRISQKNIKKNKSVFWLNSLRFNNFSSKKVRFIGNYLKNKGIEVRSGFWPLYNTPDVKKIIIKKKEDIAKKIFDTLLVLPSNIELNFTDVLFFKKEINKAINTVEKN